MILDNWRGSNLDDTIEQVKLSHNCSNMFPIIYFQQIAFFHAWFGLRGTNRTLPASDRRLRTARGTLNSDCSANCLRCQAEVDEMTSVMMSMSLLFMSSSKTLECKCKRGRAVKPCPLFAYEFKLTLYISSDEMCRCWLLKGETSKQTLKLNWANKTDEQIDTI